MDTVPWLQISQLCLSGCKRLFCQCSISLHPVVNNKFTVRQIVLQAVPFTVYVTMRVFPFSLPWSPFMWSVFVLSLRTYSHSRSVALSEVLTWIVCVCDDQCRGQSSAPPGTGGRAGTLMSSTTFCRRARSLARPWRACHAVSGWPRESACLHHTEKILTPRKINNVAWENEASAEIPLNRILF